MTAWMEERSEGLFAENMEQALMLIFVFGLNIWVLLLFCFVNLCIFDILLPAFQYLRSTVASKLLPACHPSFLVLCLNPACVFD